MKRLYTLSLAIAVLILMAAKPTKNSYYYFCISRSGDTSVDGTPIKRTVLYSKISLMNSDKADCKLKAKQWDEWVDSRCISKTPCTSDANFYQTEAEAQKAYSEHISHYADTSRYRLQLVDFR